MHTCHKLFIIYDLQRGVYGICIGIYRISIHLYWNFSSGVIANYLLVVFKPDISIWFPPSLDEGRGKGSGF